MVHASYQLTDYYSGVEVKLSLKLLFVPLWNVTLTHNNSQVPAYIKISLSNAYTHSRQMDWVLILQLVSNWTKHAYQLLTMETAKLVIDELTDWLYLYGLRRVVDSHKSQS